MKVKIISVLAAAGALTAAALPWLEAGSPAVQQAQCFAVGHANDPLATVCPTQSPT